MRKIRDLSSVAMRKYLHGIIRQMAENYAQSAKKKGGLSMEIYVGKHAMLTEAESLYDKMWDDFFGDRKTRVRNRRERAKQDKLRSKTYLRIIAEVKPDTEFVALNEWLKYA